MDKIWAAYDKANEIINQSGDNVVEEVYEVFKNAKMNLNIKMVEDYVAGKQRELLRLKQY